MKVALVFALVLFSAAAAGGLINESHVNGTSSQLFKTADSHSAANLPTPETKAGASQGSLKILNSEADLPKDDKSLLKWKGDHFEVPLSATPFEGYLVRDQGGELKLSLVVDDQTKLSSDLYNKDVVRLQFPDTRRFMDIRFFVDGDGCHISCFEAGRGNDAAFEKDVEKFDLIIPVQGIAMLKGGADTSSTKLSYSDVPAISIANSKEVVRVKVSVQAQGTATFLAFFEPGTIALADPKTDDALIGGLVGGSLSLIVVVVVAVIIYKKCKQKKKIEKAVAVVDSAKGGHEPSQEKSMKKSQSKKRKGKQVNALDVKKSNKQPKGVFSNKEKTNKTTDMSRKNEEKPETHKRKSKKVDRRDGVKTDASRVNKSSARRASSKEASQSAVDESRDTQRDHVKMLNQVLLSKLRSKPAGDT